MQEMQNNQYNFPFLIKNSFEIKFFILLVNLFEQKCSKIEKKALSFKIY